MRSFKIGALICFLALFGVLQSGVWASKAAPPMASNNCLKCHQGIKDMTNVLAGNLAGTSMQAKSIQVKINNRMELVKFTSETTVENIPDIKALKGAVAMRVHYKTVGSDRIATEIVVKPKIKVPEKQLINAKELAKLVKMGPEKGGYMLVDSRPPGGFMQGHIPTAVSIPFPKMKEMAGKLPQDKNKLLVFYCQGYR